MTAPTHLAATQQEISDAVAPLSGIQSSSFDALGPSNASFQPGASAMQSENAADQTGDSNTPSPSTSEAAEPSNLGVTFSGSSLVLFITFFSSSRFSSRFVSFVACLFFV